ncbi:MAG: PKD domain-containing protein [Candidatus Sumerlaeota bacterium]|nr:PKD domain-containing protein [Candidatus Sumerlaeota bacterium]
MFSTKRGWMRIALRMTMAVCAAAMVLAPQAAHAEDVKPTAETLAGKQFRFTWKMGNASGDNGVATLGKDGTIAGIRSANETFWLIDGEGRLVFKHRDGRVSTIFTQAERREGRWVLSGPFQFRQGVEHWLEEIASGASAPLSNAVKMTALPVVPVDPLNLLVRPYSKQRIVCLDPGEAYLFALANGTTKTIRLISVQERRDHVNNLVRRADVRVEIDGQPLDLICGPYVMPTETAGLRIQADITTGWSKKPPKRVQFSLWDAADPIVDTKRFGFPIRNFRLFSHGTQAFTEPLHLGRGDGDPAGLKGYHDYGSDMGGYENGEEIVSATDGEVLRFWPSDETRQGVVIQDGPDMNWGYVHLASYAPEIAVGARVTRGQKIGMLGKTGPSGNFSHLHLGRSDGQSRNVNLYPWLVTAYEAEHPKGLFAVARPHHDVLTGEPETFDGANSLAFGGRKIVEWRWVFHDGETIRQTRAEKVFSQPGAYVATLWVKDDHGAEDVDFCQVKVFSKSNPESAMPHIYMTSTPTEDLRPSQSIRFRFWFQGKGAAGPITVSFDDGAQISDYKSYTELTHAFKTPGIHIVTAQCEADGRPITNKIKVVVGNVAGRGL